MKTSEKELLFKKYYKRLCLYAYKLLGNMNMAEDMVQDSFYSYFNSMNKVSSDEDAIISYLYSSVKFSCYNHFRARKIEQRYWQLSPFQEVDDCDIDYEIAYAEILNEIHEIVRQMPDACEKVFRMGYLEGIANAEIATELGISVNTVKTQKRRGMKVLLSKLNPEHLALFLLFLDHRA